MNKTILLLIISLTFLCQVFAQETLTQKELQLKNLEENGNNSVTYYQEQDLLTLGLTWNGILSATEPFGRSIGGQIGDYIYVFCGQANSSLALAYHIPSNTWMASTVCNSPAYNSAFCVANGELYKLSGTSAVSVFEKFTPNGTGTGTWTNLAGGPTDVMNAQNSIAWDGGDYIYAHSSNYSTTSPASYLSRYSISLNSWVNLTPTTYIKRYPGLSFHNGYLYLVGGLILTGEDPTICLKYDPGTDTWTTISSLPEGVNFCKWTTTSVGDYVVLVGSGGGWSTYPSSPKVFYYNTLTDTWTYDGDVPAERGLALGFFAPSISKIFFGGGNMGGSSTNYQVDCWTGEGSFIPVELASFAANVSGSTVSLSWMTATEVNNSHFEIQRSIDGIGFEQIGTVSGHGTTSEVQYYSFEDKELYEGKYFYRLKQVDFDGAFEFSDVVDVDVISPNQFELKQNYPNPFNPSTIISFSIPQNEFVQLSIYDVMGNEVTTLLNEQKSAGTYSIEFDAAGLASGTYFYKLRSGSNFEIRKMILIK